MHPATRGLKIILTTITYVLALISINQFYPKFSSFCSQSFAQGGIVLTSDFALNPGKKGGCMILPSTNGENIMKRSELVKINEVLKRCAMSRSTVYRMISEKRFPTPVSVIGNRAVAWREEDIQRWIEERPTIGK